MTTFYSNHFGPKVGETGHFTTNTQAGRLVNAGERHGRVRHSHALVTVPTATDLADNDEIMWLGIKSSDRIGELRVSCDANWGATTDFNIGLHKVTATGALGTVIDEDLFAGQIDMSGAIARVDYFAGSNGSLDNWDRWKMAWELAAIGAASYTVDPVEQWAITFTASSNNSAAAAAVEMMVEVLYKAGD